MTAAAVCSEKLAVGIYEADPGVFMEIINVQMPGYPGYDGGAPGVSIGFGRNPRERGASGNRWFVLADSVDAFWAHCTCTKFRGRLVSGACK